MLARGSQLTSPAAAYDLDIEKRGHSDFKLAPFFIHLIGSLVNCRYQSKKVSQGFFLIPVPEQGVTV